MQKRLSAWLWFVAFAFCFFSTPLLFVTLFSPLRGEGKAGDLGFVERIAFFFMSRIVGFVLRIFLITAGLIFTGIAICLLPIFILFPIRAARESLARRGSVGMDLTFGSTFVLDKHSRPLVFSRDQKLYGREEVVSMIERGIARDGNNNVLVVGEPGVGKSTVLGYFSQLASSGLSDKHIRYHRVAEVIMEGLSKQDFADLLAEANRAKNVILVIENIDQYASAIDILMPYLRSDTIAIIGTASHGGAAALNSRYAEFASLFEKVDLFSSSLKDTALIIADVAHATGMRLAPEVIAKIIELGERYQPSMPEPARSLAILEELRALGHRHISVEDVEMIVSQKTNVPIGALSMNETDMLKSLEERMKRKVIGQDEAVHEVASAMKRLRTGVADPKKPAGSFLFLGPTGVGKTQTAKVLAESYFGHANAMIRFDMSEFALAESIEILKERLARAIEVAPMSLVFFDELEKAHRTVHNLLLQVLDEGRLTENDGRTANLKNAIIIATSNAGSADIIANPEIKKDALVGLLIERGIYAPEFLNRFSAVVLFSPLDPNETREITKLMLAEVAERMLAEKKITLVLSDSVIDKVAKAGFDPEFGARPIKRAIEELIENKIADQLLDGAQEGTLVIN